MRVSVHRRRHDRDQRQPFLSADMGSALCASASAAITQARLFSAPACTSTTMTAVKELSSGFATQQRASVLPHKLRQIAQCRPHLLQSLQCSSRAVSAVSRTLSGIQPQQPAASAHAMRNQLLRSSRAADARCPLDARAYECAQVLAGLRHAVRGPAEGSHACAVGQ